MSKEKIRIIIDDGIPFIKGILDDFARVTYLPSRKINHTSVKKADALITRTTVRCNARLLDSTPVKFIASATIGTDHIDTEYCEKKGIGWSNAPGCNAGAVTQYMLSALLQLMDSTGMPPEALTIGIVGVGHVGSRVEKVARAMGFKVLLNDPPRARKEASRRFVPLSTIQERSDVVTLHVPLIHEGPDKTFKMADGSFFRKLKRPSWFINTSRGAVVDEKALLEALKEGIVSRSVIDVWENEPDINTELLKYVTIGTPHIAGYSTEGKANGTAACVRAVSKRFDLGLDDWFPGDLPGPTNDHFGIDTTGKAELQILSEAVAHTYDIFKDHQAFRDEPLEFSNLRDNYPYRREPSFYDIRSGNIQPRIILKLKKLGFGVI